MSRWQKGFCNVCGRKLSIYNTGAQCFFHSIPDRSQNLISEESYSPVKYVDPGDGSPGPDKQGRGVANIG